MANNGTIKYCVNWNNTETVTSPQRVLIARALQNYMQEWFDVLVGFDGFPLTTVDVDVVSYAAKSVDQLQGDTTDFLDGPIGNQGNFLMHRPDYIIHVAEFDAWMLRDWWRKTKAHRNW
ncbi:hypothetical protein D6D01_04992 [Aureobasidium pullulans]|uniref:Uncharacterized protein n=1 Tax=Aureobasidium pullulans TaxID=5580 RepID=A0A4S9LAB1_AURPU|nr:hypothetical protein D6D01_04992 [Aureobasidium pullulans]